MQYVFQMIQRLGKCEGLPQWLCVCTGKEYYNPNCDGDKRSGLCRSELDGWSGYKGAQWQNSYFVAAFYAVHVVTSAVLSVLKGIWVE